MGTHSRELCPRGHNGDLMANKPQGISWHPTALRLKAEGCTAGEIVEALKDTSAAPRLEAVKKFLSRASKDPGQALKTLAMERFSATPRVVYSEDDNRTLAEMFMALEKRRLRVLTKALIEAEEYLDSDHMSIERTQTMKFAGTIELLKALKTGTADTALLFSTHPSPEDRIKSLTDAVTPGVEAAAVPSAAAARIKKTQ